MTTDKRIKVLIVDDHPTVRAGLEALINDETDMEVVAKAQNCATALDIFLDAQPDVTLMDLQLPDGDGETVIAQILERDAKAVIIALTTHGGADTIKRTLAAGARGFMLKSTARRDIVNAIRSANAGRRVVRGEVAERLADALHHDDLTPREFEVLKTMALGNSNKSIAYELGISQATVKIHVGSILQKLYANDRTDAVMKALERGIIRVR